MYHVATYLLGRGAVYLEVHDDGGVQGCDCQVQVVPADPDAQSHTAQTWLPLQLPWSLQIMILACVCVQHGLDLQERQWSDACNSSE